MLKDPSPGPGGPHFPSCPHQAGWGCSPHSLSFFLAFMSKFLVEFQISRENVFISGVGSPAHTP